MLTLGGGDITTLADDLLAEAHARGGGVIVADPGSAPRRRARGLARACARRAGSSSTRPLAGLTTYRVGGPAAVLVRARREGDLAVVAEALRRHRPPLLIVGRGSNLLIADGGSRASALCSSGEFEEITPGEGTVRAGGAVGLPVLARQAAAAGLSGLEFYVGIPGTVGGAVRMNAGGHGRETARGPHLGARRRPARRRAAASIAAIGRARRSGTATSSIGPSQVVAGATFRVECRHAGRVRGAHHRDRAVAPGEPTRRCERGVRVPQPARRQRGQPHRGGAASRTSGSAARSSRDKHANFIQAEPGATAADVRALVAEVQRRVRDATGIELQPELHFVGFDDDEAAS